MGKTDLEKYRGNMDNAPIISCFVSQRQIFILILKQPKNGGKGEIRYKEKKYSIFAVNSLHILPLVPFPFFFSFST